MGVQERQQEKTYTAEDVWHLSLQGEHYELYKGKLYEISPGNQIHGEVGGELYRLIANFVREHKLGRMYTAETGFDLPGGVVFAPDIAFVSKERAKPRGKGFAEIAPDLAVEVFSPSNTKLEMQQKADGYFAAGTRLLWVVYPASRTIHVYTATDQITVLNTEKTLEGGDVLPGFNVKVTDLFSVLDE
jgi:Uma2 family endonuclease